MLFKKHTRGKRMSKAKEVFKELHASVLRKKSTKRRKVVKKVKKIIQPADQTVLKPVRVNRSAEMARQEIFERNKRLAEESMRYDMVMHEKRKRAET